MPRFREDANRCAQFFSNICTAYKPSWGDTQILLKKLFQSGERDKIIEVNHYY